MVADFRFIVVGRGMMGAAAARHLAMTVDGVALIGPDEPIDRSHHDGVFASHYDEGRITRTIDPDADWARLANRSIGRYAEIARDSGIDFYTPVGALIVGPKRGGSDPYIQRTLTAATDLGVDVDVLDDHGLVRRFPFFSFRAESEGVFEATAAGHISPRRLVKAQSYLAERAGARILSEVVSSVRDEGEFAVVTTAKGERYTAEKVLLAAGGFSIAQSLLARPVEMMVCGRTIVFFEVDEAEALRHSTMPSLISKPAKDFDSIYLLPPILYPDGKYYVKIGGDPDDFILNTDADLRAWFKTDGREAVITHLTRILGDLMPDLKTVSATSGSCVVSHTPSGYPMIGYTSSSRIAVLTGGCGAAAKSSDEIGRLGAELILNDRIIDDGYTTDFVPYFA